MFGNAFAVHFSHSLTMNNTDLLQQWLIMFIKWISEETSEGERQEGEKKRESFNTFRIINKELIFLQSYTFQ